MIKKIVGRRYSLAKIIISIFCTIVILFLFVLVLFSSRLDNFQSILVHITEQSFPEMELSRAIHDDANELLYFSSHLASSTTKVALSVVKKKIDDKINGIKNRIIEQDRHLTLLTQLKVIRAELDNLYQLVKQKRVREELILKENNKLYSLHESVFELLKNMPESQKQIILIKDWMLTYSEVITLATNGLTKQRLQDVRRIILGVKTNIELLDRSINSLPNTTRKNARVLTHQLKELLLDDSKLLTLKIEQLRIAGRVIGHDNFVKNLIDDFLRQTEYQSYQINKAVVENTKNIVKDTKSEAKLITIISVCVLIVLFFVMAFIERFFVKRIVTLNKNVMARVNGDKTSINIGGNDEISDMANAFDFFSDKVEEQKQRLESLSLTDALTGLPNRRALDERLKHDIDTAKRNALPLSVMLMDIDYFKKYNDAYGHIVGDSCLQEISNVLSGNIQRETDFVARYGGEEFLFILPDTKLDGAKKIAENIRNDLVQLEIKHEASDVSSYVTLSMGITVVQAQDKRDTLGILEDADHALYQAKQTGRDRCFTDNDVL